jgi:4-amino-4-deoxy-L-arabinose transferase-like glycosyltransferase
MALAPATTHRQTSLASDNTILIALAACLTLLHVLTNGQYGFHRDELATLDDARYLAWGYVAYPPVTPFLGRISLELFGTSLRGARFFPALAQAVCVILGGLMAREMGGNRFAQVLAALAVAVAPVALASGALLQYVAFDYLWWVLTAYFVIRLLRSDDPRWWLGIGAAIGLGMLTKYSMIFLVAGLVVGLLLTDARKYLKSRWLWMGVGLSLLIFLPNFIWQMQHQFISLDFLRHIHARDVRIGRTAGFLPDQLKIAANFVTIPLWIAGLIAVLTARDFKLFRPVAWMFLVPFVLFVIAKGRGYYLAPAYPMLLAVGAVVEERWVASLPALWSRVVRTATFVAITLGGVLVAALALPVIPISSPWWARADNGDFREEIGWPELTSEVARIWNTLPADEKNKTAILAANYGEVGAIDLYGAAFGLPKAISGVNSYWQRGYGDPPPQTLIVLGLSADDVHHLFESCELSGHTMNSYGVKNEETMDHPDIFVCHQLRYPWPEFWTKFRHFG